MAFRSFFPGDEAPRAWDEVWDELWRKAEGLARFFSRNPSDAEDIAQDAIIAIGKMKGEFKGEGPFWALLRYAVWTKAIEHHRKHTRRCEVPTVQSENLETNAYHTNSVELPVIIRDAMNKLPDKYRVVVEMKYVEEYTYTEIAKSLGVAIGTVYERLTKARLLLCELLNDE